MRKAIIAAGTALSICLLLLSGCGQMGPLYLPDEAETNEAESESPTGTEPSETS